MFSIDPEPAHAPGKPSDSEGPQTGPQGVDSAESPDPVDGVETSAETPTETATESAIEAPTETPSETPTETATESTIEAPAETSAETPTELPAEPATETSAEPTPGPFDRVPEAMRGALVRRGFEELTPVQVAALDVGLSFGDVRISSQTGSGKTVALGFVMAPQLIASIGDWNPRKGKRGPGAVVIVPTRELAAQVHEELKWLFADAVGVHVDSVTGGTNVGQERRRLDRSPRILVGTPGRLLDHIEKGAVDCSEVLQIVLDEADQMLDMGFRDELEAILDKMPEERHTHLVSATFPPAVRKLTERYQTAPVHVEGSVLGAAHADIEHIGHLVHGGNRYDALVNLLLLADGQRTLVFVQTRVEAAEVAQRLSSDGFAVLPLSGELQQAQRTRTLSALKTGAVSTLIATDVAARGLDVPDVSSVIHFDTPRDAASYTHRSGRTGRAGNKGRSVILVPVRNERRIRSMMSSARIELQWHDVPTAAKVRKQIGKRDRRRIQAHLDSAPELTEAQSKYAQGLLQDKDAVQVLAGVLQLVQSQLPTNPRELDVPSIRNDRSRGDRGGYDRPVQKGRADRSYGSDRPQQDRSDRPDRRGYGLRSDRRSDRPARQGAERSDREPRPQNRGQDYERFTVTWGDRRGANPKRLLALVCRRGGVSSKDVGAIIVGPYSSTVEVACEAARGFEAKARRRDSRDPQIHINPAGRGESRPPRHGEAGA